jgi:hypothetical protein
MTAVSIIHYTGATAKSQSVLVSLATDTSRAGADVTVIDIGRTTVIRQGFPPTKLVKALGHTVFDHAFSLLLTQAGVQLVGLPPGKKVTKILKRDRQALDQALESELLTYFRLDHIPDTPEAHELKSALHQAMLDTYFSLFALWSNSPPDQVIIPNGRTSRQKAARLVAERLGIEVLLYENGRATPSSYYLGTTQPHDRIASQKELLGGFPLPKGRALKEKAESWLADRMAIGGGTNDFSQGWETLTTEVIPTSDSPTAVFFASSFDEFRAFGPMWSIDSWASQFEAFDSMMSILEEKGVTLVLRLHPNLGSKSREYFLRETEEVLALKAKHPGLTIHWHNQPANSYDLIRTATYVIVERSTIGLEASVMGKPVWVTQASQWDMMADIRQVLKPSDITADAMALWKPSPVGAQKFVSYWMAQEHPLHREWQSWATWNPDQAPLRMKMAQLALPNSLRHKVRLLRLELAKWQNHRFVPPGK